MMHQISNVKSAVYKLQEKVFIYPGDAAWHFFPIPKKVGIDIKEKYGKYAKGFGSLPVVATVGKTTWQTSIFPEKTSGSYILPVKAAVRKAEAIQAGERVSCTIELRI